MKRHINTPYKLNFKMYSLIGGISIVVMIVASIYNNATNSLISEIVKNLAYGCVASTIVAFLIEIGNVKEKNDKANSVYDAVYSDLKYQIMWYLETWANLCAAAFDDEDYINEKHTWIEWYEIAEQKFSECNTQRQATLRLFFDKQLISHLDETEKAIGRINNNQYLLDLNGIYDEGIRRILVDLYTEIHVAKLTLESSCDNEYFWESFDAGNKDLEHYIYNWVDIRLYNSVKFKPHHFWMADIESE